jgi:glucokinase
VIVLGGGAIAFGEMLIAPARREVERYALNPMNKTRVVAAELGPAAGMIGAAAFGRMEAEAA